jgi:RimJ/RimL family protein N-acetyltransferase
LVRRRLRQDLVDPGAMLATIHELDSGLRIGLRLTRPSDAPRVRAFLERLSADTRLKRFFMSTPTIDEKSVNHFTFYNPRERIVVAATAPLAGVEEIIGLADIALVETGVAELGIVVDDEHQRHGVGGALIEAVASLAAAHGATHLRAELLDHNRPMIRLLERFGRTVQTMEDGHIVALTRLPLRRGRRAA